MKSLFAMCAIVCVIVTALTAGCGSGAASTLASTSGVFADALAQGLSYTCGSTTGVTGTGGTFTCPEGSTATFSVGGVILCSEQAQAFITPLSCVQATNSSANTSTPTVVALAQFLQSISITPESSGTLTITTAELTAAAGMSLNFATATQGQLLAEVDAIAGGSTLLVSPADAQDALTGLIFTADSGVYIGNFTGTQGSAGTFSAIFATNGTVSGLASGGGETLTIAGHLTNGTTFSGTATSGSDTATWVGTLNTSKIPYVFGGTWSDVGDGTSGTFGGTNCSTGQQYTSQCPGGGSGGE